MKLDGSQALLIAIAIGVIFLVTILYQLLKRYKRCPSDKILVVYGRVGKNKEAGRTAKCIHGGAAFIWPVFQDYAFLDLRPIAIEANLTNALSKQNIRIDVPSRFTVGISTEPGIMENAAERLLGLDQKHVYDLAQNIIFGQLRLVIATMDIEEINSNRDKFLANVAANVEAELKKIGLKLINVNVTDIKDESGYIEALGKEAAAKAINDARISVAEKTRDGSIGEANAVQEQRVRVSEANAKAKIGEANADQEQRIQIANADAKAKIGEADAKSAERISISDANAKAVDGENKAKIEIARSEAERREAEAESLRKAIAAEKVKQAKALEEAYDAERKAEVIRAERDLATRNADIIIPAEIEKRKVEIDAAAEAEQTRIRAKGEADAIYLKMEAEAKGIYEILSKQAEGFQQLVRAAGNNSRDAVMIMIADKLPELVKTQADAIKNIKIDKVTVWDSGNGHDGKSSTANFVSGLYKAVPPLEEMFNMAGMQLPEYLRGKNNNNDTPKEDLPAIQE